MLAIEPVGKESVVKSLRKGGFDLGVPALGRATIGVDKIEQFAVDRFGGVVHLSGPTPTGRPQYLGSGGFGHPNGLIATAAVADHHPNGYPGRAVQKRNEFADALGFV